uniref:DUF2339 domain-containing protein n=1 Tax=Parastrongyloides trichosuri TaxID=131310 RepID=A0A0N4ZLC7_PARTI
MDRAHRARPDRLGLELPGDAPLPARRLAAVGRRAPRAARRDPALPVRAQAPHRILVVARPAARPHQLQRVLRARLRRGAAAPVLRGRIDHGGLAPRAGAARLGHARAAAEPPHAHRRGLRHHRRDPHRRPVDRTHRRLGRRRIDGRAPRLLDRLDPHPALARRYSRARAHLLAAAVRRHRPRRRRRLRRGRPAAAPAERHRRDLVRLDHRHRGRLPLLVHRPRAPLPRRGRPRRPAQPRHRCAARHRRRRREPRARTAARDRARARRDRGRPAEPAPRAIRLSWSDIRTEEPTGMTRRPGGPRRRSITRVFERVAPPVRVALGALTLAAGVALAFTDLDLFAFTRIAGIALAALGLGLIALEAGASASAAPRERRGPWRWLAPGALIAVGAGIAIRSDIGAPALAALIGLGLMVHGVLSAVQ